MEKLLWRGKVLLLRLFGEFFAHFGAKKTIAPTQHPTLAARLEKSDSTAPSPLPVCCFHIHSKTACRGANACQWQARYEPTGAVAQTESF